jgi:D-xylose transport system substrate-binding protein
MRSASFFRAIRFVLIIGLFGSCSSNGSKLKIGFSMRNLTLDRCKQEKQFFSERVSQLGGELVFAEANDDDQKQIEQSIEMLDQGVNVLVVFPVNLTTSAAIVREANNRKVKVIAYESLIQNCNLDYYISADNEKGGKLMAEYILKLVPQGNYVLLGGNKADRNAILIKNGNHEIIDPILNQGKVKIIYDVYADWTADEGYQETKKILDLSGIIPDAILSSNDGLATGVIQALTEYGLAGKIPVTGLDAELSACQRVAKGTQTLTIYKSFKKQAYAAADMAFQIASGKKVENVNNEVFNGSVKVPTYLIDPVLVDKNNLRDVIVKNGVYSEKDVFGSN